MSSKPSLGGSGSKTIRPSAGGATDIASLPTSLQLLHQKQQEHSGLLALKEASGNLVQRVEKLSEMTHVMADGGEAVGKVMQNWGYIFDILAKINVPEAQDHDDMEPVPQMVRMPFEDPDAPKGKAAPGEAQAHA